MALLEAKIYHGCIRCDGLFSTSILYTQHAVVCTGERQKSDCQLFACPRDRFLAFCESEVIRASIIDSNTGSTNDDNVGGVPESIPGCYTSPLRKVKVVGIVKRTITQFPQNDKAILCSDSTGQEVERQPIVGSERLFQGEVVTYDCGDLSKKLESSQLTQESMVKDSDCEPSQTSQVYSSQRQVPRFSLTESGTIQYCDPLTQGTTQVQFKPVQCQVSSNITLDGTQNPMCIQDQTIPERSLKESNEIISAIENPDTSTAEVQYSLISNDGPQHLQYKATPERALKEPNEILGAVENNDTTTAEVQYTQISTQLPEEGTDVSIDPYGLTKVYEGVDELREHPAEPPQAEAADLPQTAFMCEICGVESYDKEFMQRHSQSHESAQKDDSVLQKPKTFLCEQCPLQFKNRSSLTRHSAKKHNGKSNFMCEYGGCGYVAVNSASLRDHIRKHTGEWLACDYDNCKFTTRFEKALCLHKAKHQGKTRFICEVCGYKTIEAGSFRRHCLNHTDKKLFKCPDCSYKANTRYSIVKHIYGKHINHKRYACNRCDFKTAYYSGLSMHLMSHEGVKPFKCSACSYRSNLSNKVKRHCAQKHKGGEASVDKLENCFKFDVKDYLNPDVQKLEVKVLRLGVDGSEEVVYSDEPEVPPGPIDPEMSEDGALLCETNMSSLPSESAETLEAISMIDGGFNLCSDPTFQLDSVSQAFRSEDSNNGFVTRSSEMICEQDVDLIKDMDTQNIETIETDLPMQAMSSKEIQDISESKSDMFSNMDITSLDTLETTESKSIAEVAASLSQQNSSVDIVLTSVPKDANTIRTKHPILTNISPFFQIITVPLITVPNLLLQQAKDAQSGEHISSLTTTETVKDSNSMDKGQALIVQPQMDTQPEEAVQPLSFALPVGSHSESDTYQQETYQSTSSICQLSEIPSKPNDQQNVLSEPSVQENAYVQQFTKLKQSSHVHSDKQTPAHLCLGNGSHISDGHSETNTCPISVTHLDTQEGIYQVTLSGSGLQGSETLDSVSVLPVVGSQPPSKPLKSLLSPDFIKVLAKKTGQGIDGEEPETDGHDQG